MAYACDSHNFLEFWRKVNDSSKGKSNTLSNKVGDKVGADEITDSWASHYKTLFFSDRSIELFKQSECSEINFNEEEIFEACKLLKKVKSRGTDDILIENFLFAHESLLPYLTELVNSIFKYSFIPTAITEVIYYSQFEEKKLRLYQNIELSSDCNCNLFLKATRASYFE